MASFHCDECRAIYQELQTAFVAAKERLSGQNPTQLDLARWVQELSEDECARARETSSLWATWRRLQEHRALTGHYLSLLRVNPN